MIPVNIERLRKLSTALNRQVDYVTSEILAIEKALVEMGLEVEAWNGQVGFAKLDDRWQLVLGTDSKKSPLVACRHTHKIAACRQLPGLVDELIAIVDGWIRELKGEHYEI